MKTNAPRGSSSPGVPSPPPEPIERAPEDCLTSHAKVAYIHELMCAQEWDAKKTGNELAKVWGIKRSTVLDYSGEAARLFRIQLQNPEAMRGTIIAAVMDERERAHARTEEVVDACGEVHEVSRPDNRTALRALEVLLDVTGLRVNKHEHKNLYDGVELKALLLEAQEYLDRLQPTPVENAEPEEYSNKLNRPRKLNGAEDPRRRVETHGGRLRCTRHAAWS